MPKPDISVIVAAYNAMPYVTKCVASVLNQTLDPSRCELIVVDDGSTDGTAHELKRLATGHSGMRVVHQPNSGGPAAPRNLGLNLARGRYVFFLDADDWLSPDALRRMLQMAEQNNSDIVLGRMVGVNGRIVPTTMFGFDQPRTDVFHSRVYWALNALKLFRRDFVEDLELRFPTDLPVGQDQPFVATAYLRAKVISVLASYDCYYATLRDDGQNNTQRTDGVARRMPCLRAVFELVPRLVAAGPDRDLLLRRHFQSEQREFLDHLAREAEPDGQREAFEEFRGLVNTWCTTEVAAGLPAPDRLRLELIRRGLMKQAIACARLRIDDGSYQTVAENGRVYGGFPGFRDPELALDDGFFDITDDIPLTHLVTQATWRDTGFALAGEVSVKGLLMTDSSVSLSLRDRESGVRHQLPASTTPSSASVAFDTSVDPQSAADGKPLPPGLWDTLVTLDRHGSTRESRVGAAKTHRLDGEQTWLVGAPERTVTSYFTKPFGNLTFDVGARKKWGASPCAATMRWGGTIRSPHLDIDLALRIRDVPLEGAALALVSDDFRVDVPGRLDPATAVYSSRLAFNEVLADCLTPQDEWCLELRLLIHGGWHTFPVPHGSPMTAKLWWRAGWPKLIQPRRRQGGMVFHIGGARPDRAARFLRRRIRHRPF